MSGGNLSDQPAAEAHGLNLKFASTRHNQKWQIMVIGNFVAQGADAILIASVVTTNWDASSDEA